MNGKTLFEAAILGFTGTQQGMTEDQKMAFEDILACGAKVLHHGDCRGADAQAWRLARTHGFKTVCHPPNVPKKRAFTMPNEETREELPYLVRNQRIVDESEILIATPKGFEEELRSGTWATIRYAQRRKKPVVIIWPDGELG